MKPKKHQKGYLWFKLKNPVHTPLLIAFHIKSNIKKAYFPQFSDNCRSVAFLKNSFNLYGIDLYPGHIAVQPYTTAGKTEALNMASSA